MYIVPYTREARTLSRVFDRNFERFLAAAVSDGNDARNPALDVVESDKAYTVKLDIPGVNKEDVKVSVDGRKVTVQAKNEKTDERAEGEQLVYRERSSVSYARSFTLATEVDQTEAAAKLENGVLTLTLPKRGVSTSQLTVN